MEKFIKRRLVFILIDLILVFSSFLIATLVWAGTLSNHLPRYLNSLFIFMGVWLFISWFGKKYFFRNYTRFRQVIRPIIFSNLAIIGTITILMFFFREAYFSRGIVLGTIFTATVIELFFGILYHFVKVARENGGPADREFIALKNQKKNDRNGSNGKLKTFIPHSLSESIQKLIENESGKETFDFLQKSNKYPSEDLLVVSTTNPINFQTQSNGHHKSIINLKRINDIRYINKFFETVNETLPLGGCFTCCVETKDLRKKRIFRKFPFPINYFFYYFIDFPIKRVLPKFNTTKKLYFFLTRGENRVITRAETLGRLISCGFEISDEEYINNLCYISAKKVASPLRDSNPSYGPIIRLKRIGKNGKIIRVHKMRTMYPYAEYLQEYIYQNNDLKKGGKFNNDFRVSTQGKFMRKFWIDELPMISNLVSGDIKLVGVRPLSKQYYNLYSNGLREKRVKQKPGLIPPFYADMPKTIDEIQESEIKYLESYEKHPIRTDWNYFWKAWYNIVFKKARSQ